MVGDALFADAGTIKSIGCAERLHPDPVEPVAVYKQSGGVGSHELGVLYLGGGLFYRRKP